MKEVIAVHAPVVEWSRLVQDHWHPHTPGAFYEALPPQEAFALAQNFEPPYTPRKGSWLNMADIERSALARQCLDRRMGDRETFRNEVAAWH